MRNSRFSIILSIFIIVFGINQIGENSFKSTIFSGKLSIPKSSMNYQLNSLGNNDQQITTQCAEISTIDLTDTQNNLLIGEPYYLGEVFTFEIASGRKTPFFAERFTRAIDFTISPDGKWLAYMTWQPEKNLIVESLVTGEKYSHPWDFDGSKYVASIYGWLNNEQILIWYFDSEKSNGVTLYNPFTQNKTKMDTNFPELTNQIWYWKSWPSVAIYDPTLSYAAYLSDRGGYKSEGNQTLVLWDMKQNKQLAAIDNFGLTDVHPIWKKNSKGVYLVKAKEGEGNPPNDELFYIGVDGTVKQLTTLQEDFPGKGIRIYNPKLSADEKTIAMFIEVRSIEDRNWVSSLMFLDLESGKIRDTCIRDETDWTFENHAWADNGKLLAYVLRDSTDKHRKLWVIDVEKNKTKMLAEDASIYLWLK